MDWALVHVMWDPEAISLVFSNDRDDLVTFVVDPSTGSAIAVGGDDFTELGRFEPGGFHRDFDQIGGIDLMAFIEGVLDQVPHRII